MKFSLSSNIATNGSRQSKGYGFVHFEQDEAAKEATGKMNDVVIEEKRVHS